MAAYNLYVILSTLGNPFYEPPLHRTKAGRARARAEPPLLGLAAQPRYLCEKARLMSFHASTIVLDFGSMTGEGCEEGMKEGGLGQN